MSNLPHKSRTRTSKRRKHYSKYNPPSPDEREKVANGAGAVAQVFLDEGKNRSSTPQVLAFKLDRALREVGY